jgi:hypothetical protein
MAKGLYIDARELTKGAKSFERLIKEFPDKVSDVLNSNALEIERNAKTAAPADRGLLRQTISADLSKPLQKHLTANAPYAAYVEFGTGKYAAEQVSKYPADYQKFASQFKGKGGGGFKDFIRLLTEWVRRKGIDKKHPERTAYAIAISILRNGVHPHPFMIPALINQQKEIVNDIKTLLNRLKIV